MSDIPRLPLPSNVNELLIQKPRPDKPFQEIAIDFCSYAGRDYLITVDCFTDWPAVISMDHGTPTPQLIETLRQSFCCTAIPGQMVGPSSPQKFFIGLLNKGILTQSVNTTLRSK